MKAEGAAFILSIDFGTTYSVVSTYIGGDPVIIPSKRGNKLIPSAVSILENGDIIVGEEAYANRFIFPDRTILSVKRKIGTPLAFQIDGKKFWPRDIASFIINYLRESAVEFFSVDFNKAILTVPANFDDIQRKEIKKAAEDAGLKVLRILNEPTAACIGYGLRNLSEGKIIVLDMGGGTFDVSLMEVEDGVFQVVATDGDPCLGGNDFDQRIVEFVMDEFRRKEGVNLTEDTYALHKIFQEAERVKKELSRFQTSFFCLPFITADNKGPKHIDVEITRDIFRVIAGDLVNRMEGPIYSVLDYANLSPQDIDSVILVGGMGKCFLVREKVASIFGDKLLSGIDPQECVAYGAALYSKEILGCENNMVLVDVTPFSLGIEVEGGYFVPVIPKNTPLPAVSKRTFTTARDNQKRVEIRILQGESRYAYQNTLLGRICLDDLKPSKRGKPKIEVTFEIDVNGIVSVRAKDKNSSKEQEIKIERLWGDG